MFVALLMVLLVGSVCHGQSLVGSRVRQVDAGTTITRFDWNNGVEVLRNVAGTMVGWRSSVSGDSDTSGVPRRSGFGIASVGHVTSDDGSVAFTTDSQGLMDLSVVFPEGAPAGLPRGSAVVVDGAGYGDYTTIRGACEAVKAGTAVNGVATSWVLVNRGTYVESVDVETTGLAIVGVARDGVTIVKPYGESSIWQTSAPLWARADGVSIANLTLVNPGNLDGGTSPSNVALKVNDTLSEFGGFSAVNCDFVGDEAAVLVTGPWDAGTTAGARFEGCTIYGGDAAGKNVLAVYRGWTGSSYLGGCRVVWRGGRVQGNYAGMSPPADAALVAVDLDCRLEMDGTAVRGDGQEVAFAPATDDAEVTATNLVLSGDLDRLAYSIYGTSANFRFANVVMSSLDPGSLDPISGAGNGRSIPTVAPRVIGGWGASLRGDTTETVEIERTEPPDEEEDMVGTDVFVKRQMVVDDTGFEAGMRGVLNHALTSATLADGDTGSFPVWVTSLLSEFRLTNDDDNMEFSGSQFHFEGVDGGTTVVVILRNGDVISSQSLKALRDVIAGAGVQATTMTLSSNGHVGGNLTTTGTAAFTGRVDMYTTVTGTVSDMTTAIASSRLVYAAGSGTIEAGDWVKVVGYSSGKPQVARITAQSGEFAFGVAVQVSGANVVVCVEGVCDAYTRTGTTAGAALIVSDDVAYHSEDYFANATGSALYSILGVALEANSTGSPARTKVYVRPEFTYDSP